MIWKKLLFRLLGTVFIVFVSCSLKLEAQVNVLHLEQITYRDGLPQNSAQTIKQDKNGFIWVSSFAGLCRYDGYQFVEYIPDPDDSTSIFTKSIYNMVLDENQDLWIAFFDTVRFCKYNYETDNFTRYTSSNVPSNIKTLSNRKITVANTYEDANVVWKFEQSQLIKRDKTIGSRDTFFLNLPMALNNDLYVTVVFLDSFGVLWIGTESQGVFKVNTHTKPFYSYFYHENGQKKIFNEFVRAIEEDATGKLWIGTMHDGVVVLDRKTLQIERLRAGGGRHSDRLQQGNVRCIYRDKNGHMWVGTKGGISEYFPNEKRFRHYNRFGKVNIPHNWVHAVLEDKDGELWIGTFDGIARYDREDDQFISIDPLKTLVNSRVFCMLVDTDNNIWVGTHGGGATCLKRTNKPDEFEPIHYLNEPGNPNTISSNRIFSLYQDKKGYVWAATENGLSKIDHKTGLVQRYNLTDGLLDDIVVSVTEDKSGNIWIATKKGLSKLNQQTGKFSHYNEKDGLQSNELSESCWYYSNRTGEMLFGTLSGLVSFKPEEITDNDILPKVVLTRLEVLNREVLPGQKINGRVILNKQITLTDRIALDYSHKSFSIEFAALQFANPMANQYKFKLEGYDKEWITASASRRIATYSNLSAGKYEFKVMASNDDGVWNPEVRNLTIVVRPPWWFSVWAFVVYIIIISSISYFSILYIIGRVQLKNEIRYEQMKARKITELNQMKEQFFTKISHELRTPLTLLIDPLRNLQFGQVEQAKLPYYYSLMYQNAQRLSKLVNELLDFKKVEAKQFEVRPTTSDLVSFLSNIANSFQLYAADRNIAFNFESNHSKIEANFDTNILEKVVFNLLSNAFKYNRENGSVSFHLKGGEERDANGMLPVEMVITDTGIGIPKESLEKIFDLYYQDKTSSNVKREGTGIGLTLTRELVLLQGGDIQVNSKENEGTTFYVKLPIGINYFDNRTLVPNEMENDKEVEPVFSEEDADNEIFANEERQCILIVEDDPDVRIYIRKVIENQFEVIEAVNGYDGFDKAIENNPDLIITDLMMPESDGYELCRRAKTDNRTSHIPIIVLTALSSEKSTLNAYELGADAFITKPFSSALLISRIRNLIANRKSLIETFGKNPFIDIKKMANNSIDEALINKAIECIEEYISEPEFNIDLLADKLSLSRRHLSHKIKTLTGQTVNEFVKTVRLNKAAELLLTTDDSVSEIAYQLGYTAPANFSRSFSKQFGKTPTEYVASFSEGK